MRRVLQLTLVLTLVALGTDVLYAQGFNRFGSFNSFSSGTSSFSDRGGSGFQSFSRRTRFSRMPRMYGDSLRTAKATFSDDFSGAVSGLPIRAPVAIADNTSPIPQHRVYFLFQNFHNAIDSDLSSISGSARTRTDDLNRYTLGVERTFIDDLASIEFRLPLTGTSVPNMNDTAGTAVIETAVLSSITAVLKGVLWSDVDSVFVGGVGIDFAIGGSDVQVNLGPANASLESNGVDFAPYIGYATSLGENAFLQSFLSVNLPTSSDDVIVTGGLENKIRRQETLTANLSGGMWLARFSEPAMVTGIAALLELHYTTSLGGTERPTGDGLASFDIHYSRFNTLNLTTGLHFEINTATAVRFGAVAPLRDGSDRQFDVELQASLNHYL
ncbi:MAG: hypothetical protein AAGG48_16590 [Planctomycetota bacterium]